MRIVTMHAVEFDGQTLIVYFRMTDGSISPIHWKTSQLEECLGLVMTASAYAPLGGILQ